MIASSYKAELPLNTLNMQELLAQFKVMRALGYTSLFDANFRREMRNPFRRAMYYRLVSTLELQSTYTQSQALKNTADRIGFYSNPELAKNVRQSEEEKELRDPDTRRERVEQHMNKYEKILNDYIPPTEEDQQAMRALLRK